MPHWVYALYSPVHDKIYVGETSDLDDRYRSHNELATKGWTVHYRPWVILYKEESIDRKTARTRERQLKSGSGREFLRSLLG
jgi:putative endonuclease